MATFNTRIQLKYDTYAAWSSANPTLLKGELALVEVPAESGTGLQEPAYLLKIGNGTKAFNELDWVGAKAADVYSWAKTATKPTYTASEIEGLSDFISGEIKDTNTLYKIVKNGNLGFKLQYKEVNGEWTDQDTITFVLTTEDIPELPTSKITGLDVTLANKQDNITFNTEYNSETNKAATMADIGNAKTELIGEGSGTSSTIKGVYNESKTYTDQQIAEKIGSVYKPGGALAFEALPSLSSDIEGKVYNITNEFTTTGDFIEGEGKKYPAGTNVVCIDSDDLGTFKWDVLSGVVDLSAYDTAEVAQGKINTAKQEAIDAAAQDATTKANQVEQNAKSYADGLKTQLDEEIAKKANNADLATVAKSGKIDDLTQTATLIFYCGTATEVMD